MNLLSRDAILSAPDTKPRRVDVPEWGGSLFVRAMTAAEAEFSPMGKDAGGTGWGAQLAARCICDENGVRLFTDADVAVLATKSAAAMNRVVLAINDLNGLGEKESASLGEASTGVPDAGSPSASPATSV